MPTVATALTLVMCSAAVVAFRRERHVAYHILKVLASAGFIAVALSHGIPIDAGWRTAVAVGLAIALVGDALLGFHKTWSFVAGMAVFLLMHVSYLAGFVGRGVEPLTVAVAFATTATAAGMVWRRAHATIPERLRPAIAGYMSVLALDLAAGVSTGITLPSAVIVAGVLLMGFSDIAVLRQRFIAPGLANKVVGLPMYYAGQLLLAWAVIAAT